MHFYTSINNNYFAKARVLAKSIKKFNPTAKFSLVLADQLMPEIDVSKEPFDEILTVDKLGYKEKNLDMWIYLHSVVELCTAVKGQALVKFLEEGSDVVVYLDPDIAVFSELFELEKLMDDNDVVLTPHLTEPDIKYEDVLNNEICALMHGTYNFGFYAVKNSENGMKFARWWRDRLQEFCFDDIPNGLFTDQKWGDLVPAMFSGVYILRSPAYNVATWNINNRYVEKGVDGKYYVNKKFPLQFYHFSGFDSGAQKSMLDLYGKNNETLYELRDWYIEQQDNAGQKKYYNVQSKYNFYSNGVKIENFERRILRSRKDVYGMFKETNPYIVEQEKSYYKWLQEAKKDGLEIDQISKLINERNELLNSKSWKITAPLREIAKFFK